MTWKSLAGSLAIALLASAAAAADISDQAAYIDAVVRHGAGTVSAAEGLAKEMGEPYQLARQTLDSCRSEEAEIAKFASEDVMRQVRRNVVYMRFRDIKYLRTERPPG